MGAIGFRDRVIGLERLPASALQGHDGNWRKHPQFQQDAMLGVLREVGIVGALLVYASPAHDGAYVVIDGHLRKELDRDQLWPCLVLDVDDAEANYILATHDPLAALAEVGQEEFGMLLREVQSGEAAVQSMLSQLGDFGEKEQRQNPPDASEPSIEYNEIYAFREDAIFASTNPYGIPDLRPDRLCQEIPTQCYASHREYHSYRDCLFMHRGPTIPETIDGGYLGFFVDDYRFEAVWRDAVSFVQQLRGHKWTGVVAPDFSLWQSMPWCLQVYNLYRRQWCARYWQEAGFPVLPILSATCGLGEEGIALSLLGLPPSVPALALQVRTGTRDQAGKKEFVQTTGACLESIEVGQVLVYGGIDHLSWLKGQFPSGPEYVYIPSFSFLAREKWGKGRKGDWDEIYRER